ncbi:MAG: methenyltetrahydromethanopterin cyclohydrolase [Candidatus Bathyarchaeota archaeon]|nr:MAG: methenyltetrahydromethanopterin cyclohydrolase [Candidatus Bathyarchaeota archaeon]
MLSINRKAYRLVQDLCGSPAEYNVKVAETKLGTTLIDAGIKAKGGFNAGGAITEICMGGLGKTHIRPEKYGDTEFASITVNTDHPAIATLGSQFAAWQIKKDNFFAIGSGPARALSMKPRQIFEDIGYSDKSDVAVLVLETTKSPPEDIIDQFSSECHVSPDQLYIVLVPTTSVAGSTQISGRIVETGVHKLYKFGIDPLSIQSAWGCAPIAPVCTSFTEAMGKTNDVILYGGVVYYTLKHADDDELKATLEKAPSSSSKQYGKPFSEIFKEAKYDFYKIDPNLFAPAKFIVNNTATGSVMQSGRIDIDILMKSLGLS